MTATAVDLKAGFCSSCRRGSHVMCSSPTCDCLSGKGHPNRPGEPTGAAPLRPAPATPPPRPKAPAGLNEPIFERVREDPPETACKARVSVADKVLPILEEIAKVGDFVWWRVAVFGKRQQASASRHAVMKKLGADVADWEFKAVRVAPPGPGASALYARRVDR